MEHHAQPRAEITTRIRQLRADLDELAEELERQPPPESEPERVIAPQLLIVEEAAQAVGLSRSAVYVLIGSGELSSVRIGSRRRVPVTAVTAYVTRLAAQQGAA